jgi:2-oxoglutarate ferredoxin oxidoreductase subunit alpha
MRSRTALPKFHRYLDKDGDGIPYRTLPGVTAKGAYFTRGSGHDEFGAYTEDSAEYRDVVDRLTHKFNTARRIVPPAILTGDGHASVGLLSHGSADGAIQESLDQLASAGLTADYLRVRAFPLDLRWNRLSISTTSST